MWAAYLTRQAVKLDCERIDASTVPPLSAVPARCLRPPMGRRFPLTSYLTTHIKKTWLSCVEPRKTSVSRRFSLQVMSTREASSEVKRPVLLALARLGDAAYGVSIRDKIENRVGRRPRDLSPAQF